MYFYVIFTIHCSLCAVLIGLVLLQQGKGADAGATFGGGGSNTVFGAAGAADFITRLTTALAIGFMITSIFLVNAFNSSDIASVSTRSVDALAGSLMPAEEVVEAVEANVVEKTAKDSSTGVVPPSEDNVEANVSVDTSAKGTASVEVAPVAADTEAVKAEAVDAAASAASSDASSDASNESPKAE